jgi:hypothetical protein
VTEDERIERGVFAETLLTSELFGKMYDIVLKDITEQIMSTPAGATAERERLFSLFDALRSMSFYLAGYSQEAKQIIENNTKSTDDY